jgi:hypothetical protein
MTQTIDRFSTGLPYRERLGDQTSWTDEDGAKLRAAISQLNDAVETLHQFELGNEAEPSFVLSL